MAGTDGTRLELTWPNKDKFLLSPKDDTGKPVWVDRSHPAASEVRLVDFADQYGQVASDPCKVSDNLLFTGDSLDVLRVLAEHPEFRAEYRGKVKCVYIDPPFNTGQAFEHYDDWMEHSTWLSFMRDRLLLIRDLLAVDGSVWVHLDDAEVHRMRCLMDEVFGAANWVASVVWQRVDNPGSRATTGIVPSNDTILVYRSSPAFRARQELRKDLPAHYDKVDAAGRPYCARALRKSGASSTRGDRESMWFPITAPDGSQVYPIKGDGTEGRWQWGQQKVLRGADTLDWQMNPRGAWEPYIRIYSPADATVPFNSWWPYTEVGSNRISKLEVKAVVLGVEPFATPKPELLLQRVLMIATLPGDLVLDCFGGSGTTAAVAHKMRRRWLCAEMSPANVRTFVKPRLAKVVAGADSGGVTGAAGWTGGGGFRCLTVGPPMYEVADNGIPLLAEWATNGRFSRAVAAQLDFDFNADGAPFCGRRGRMRLAVLDGAVGPDEVRALVAALGDDERVTVVAKVVLPGTEELLGSLSKGSRIRKAPRDVLADISRRARRRERRAP